MTIWQYVAWRWQSRASLARREAAEAHEEHDWYHWKQLFQSAKVTWPNKRPVRARP